MQFNRMCDTAAKWPVLRGQELVKTKNSLSTYSLIFPRLLFLLITVVRDRPAGKKSFF